MNINGVYNNTYLSDNLYRDCSFLVNFAKSDPGLKIEIIPPADESHEYGEFAVSGFFRVINKIIGYADSYYIFQKLNHMNQKVENTLTNITVDKTYRTTKRMEFTRQLLSDSALGIEKLKTSYYDSEKISTELGNIIQDLTHHISILDHKMKANVNFDFDDATDTELYFQYQEAVKYGGLDDIIESFYDLKENDECPSDNEELSEPDISIPVVIPEEKKLEQREEEESSSEDEMASQMDFSNFGSFLDSVYKSGNNYRSTFGADFPTEDSQD